MTLTDIFWRLFLHSAIFSSGVLLAGAIAIQFAKQPADRLRLIQCVLAGCLIAPCLPALSPWTLVSLELASSSNPTESNQPEIARDALPDSIASESRPVIGESIARPDTVASSAAAPLERSSSAASDRSPRASTPWQELSAARGLSWFASVYAGIVLAMIGWWLVGLWRRITLERSAHAASPELQELFNNVAANLGRRVRLLVSDRISGPMTWGVIRPVIIVPAEIAADVDTPQLRWSLAHELSHVERGDAGTLFVAWVTQLVCFYQPLYWWLLRQMNLCQDFLADARATQETGTAEDYAEFLVRLAESRLSPCLPAALGIIDRKSDLFRRISMLVNTEGNLAAHCSRKVAIGGLVGTLTCLAFLSTIRLEGEDDLQKKQPAAKEAAEEKVDEAKLEENVVTGILVKASDETPVADATVILFAGGSNKAKSDAEGRFRLDKIPPSDRAYPVWAHQGNLVTGKVLVRRLNTSERERAKFAPLRLEMIEGRQAQFTVKSQATGEPVRDAAVRFGYPDRRLVMTDAQGQATVPGLLPEPYEVTVEAEGYARNAPRIDLSQSGSATKFDIALRPGGVVRGVVVDAEGKPILDAEVVYRLANGSGFIGDSYRVNERGEFRNRFLPLDKPVEVSVSKDGFESQNQEATLTATTRETDLRFVLKAMPPGGSIAGTVLDSLGNSVVGAEVTNHGRVFSQKVSTKTDSKGEFVLHDLAVDAQFHDIFVAAAGFAPQRVEIKPGSREAPGNVDVQLQPGHSIRGQVQVEDDGSIKGATIGVRSTSYPGVLGNTVGVDDDGRFEIDSLPDDARFDVSLKGYSNLINIPLKLDTADPVTVVLKSPALVRGRILDATTGKPVTQFGIRVSSSRSRKPADPGGSYNGSWLNPGLTFVSQTGDFVIEPLEDGAPMELIVLKEGYEREVVERVIARKKKDAELIEVKLKKVDPATRYALSGQFVDHTGAPKAGAHLRLIVSTEQPAGEHDGNFNWELIKNGQLADKSYCEQFLSAVTDAEGRFEFKDIAPGRYLQLAFWGKGVPQGKSLAFDETAAGAADDVTIQLPEPATVRGTIDRAKFPEAEAIAATPTTRDFLRVEVMLKEGQSKFELTDLPAGEYWVTVVERMKRFKENGIEFGSRSNLASRKLSIKSGETREVHFKEPDARPK